MMPCPSAFSCSLIFSNYFFSFFFGGQGDEPRKQLHARATFSAKPSFIAFGCTHLTDYYHIPYPTALNFSFTFCSNQFQIAKDAQPNLHMTSWRSLIKGKKASRSKQKICCRNLKRSPIVGCSSKKLQKTNKKFA
jgi:hypothetical protein